MILINGLLQLKIRRSIQFDRNEYSEDIKSTNNCSHTERYKNFKAIFFVVFCRFFHILFSSVARLKEECTLQNVCVVWCSEPTTRCEWATGSFGDFGWKWIENRIFKCLKNKQCNGLFMAALLWICYEKTWALGDGT